VTETIVAPGNADLAAILLATTKLTEEQLEEARVTHSEAGGRLADHLVREGLVSADEVLDALGRQLGLPILPSIDSSDID